MIGCADIDPHRSTSHRSAAAAPTSGANNGVGELVLSVDCVPPLLHSAGSLTCAGHSPVAAAAAAVIAAAAAAAAAPPPLTLSLPAPDWTSQRGPSAAAAVAQTQSTPTGRRRPLEKQISQPSLRLRRSERRLRNLRATQVASPTCVAPSSAIPLDQFGGPSPPHQSTSAFDSELFGGGGGATGRALAGPTRTRRSGRHLVELSLCVPLQSQSQRAGSELPCDNESQASNAAAADCNNERRQNDANDEECDVAAAEVEAEAEAEAKITSSRRATAAEQSKRRLGFERIERFVCALETLDPLRSRLPLLSCSPPPTSGSSKMLRASARDADEFCGVGSTLKVQSARLSVPLRSAAVDACFCFNLLNVRVSNKRLIALERRTSARSQGSGSDLSLDDSDLDLDLQRAVAQARKKRRQQQQQRLRQRHTNESEPAQVSGDGGGVAATTTEAETEVGAEAEVEEGDENEEEEEQNIDCDAAAAAATNESLERNWLRMQRLTCDLRRALLVELARVVRPKGKLAATAVTNLPSLLLLCDATKFRPRPPQI